MLVIKKNRFLFVYFFFVLLLIITCISSYYFILNVDSLSPQQRKFAAENMIYIGILFVIIVTAILGYVFAGSIKVFAELDKLKETVKHGNYDRMVFGKRLGRLGLEINDLFIHLNNVSGKKTEKITSLSFINGFLLDNIGIKIMIIDVQGMILSVSSSLLLDYNLDKGSVLYHEIGEFIPIDTNSMIVRMSGEHNVITEDNLDFSFGSDRIQHGSITFYPASNAKGDLSNIIAVIDASDKVVFSNIVAKSEKSSLKKPKTAVPKFFIDFFK